MSFQKIRQNSLSKSCFFSISLHIQQKDYGNMNDKRILFISDQITPFVPASPIADFCRQLPQSIQEQGADIRTFMPRWGHVNERRNQLHEVIRLSGMNLIIDDTDHPLIIKVASIQSARMQVYFIDNDDYFQSRLMVCDKEGKEYQDNDERSIFFARGVLETVKKLRWNPDIIHCHGWLSSMIPMYVKTLYKEEPAFRDSKIVYSVYDKSFNNCFRDNFPEMLLTKDMQKQEVGEFEKPIDFCSVMKKAIDFSDAFICNSLPELEGIADYAKEKGLPTISTDIMSLQTEQLSDLYSKL